MILIENELVFVAVPKNASISVHDALENSDFNIKPTFNEEFMINEEYHKLKTPSASNMKFIKEHNKVKIHNHVRLGLIYDFLGAKPDAIIIKRDYCDRFISCFNYIFSYWVVNAYNIKLKKDIITNEFIYKYFTKDVVGMIFQLINDDLRYKYDKNLKKSLIEPIFINYAEEENIENIIETKLYNDTFINFSIFNSQEMYKSGYDVKYVFDIKKLTELELFLSNKFDKEIKIGKENSIPKSIIDTKIEEDQKLRDWVWKNFEKPYFTKKIF